MVPTAISLGGAVILVLDIVAIVSVLRESSRVRRKVLWIVLILLLPVVGMLLYFLLGRNPSHAHA